MGPKVRIDPCRSLGNPWPIAGRRGSPPPAARRFRPWISEIRQPGVRPFRGHRVPASRRGRPCPWEGRRRPFRCRSFLRRSSRVRRLHLPRCLRCPRRCPRPPSRNAIRRTPRSNRPLPGRASATGIVSSPLNRRPRGNPGGRPGRRRGSRPRPSRRPVPGPSRPGHRRSRRTVRCRPPRPRPRKVASSRRRRSCPPDRGSLELSGPWISPWVPDG